MVTHQSYCRAAELFKGRRFLLKSVAYEAISRADLFTLPCSHKASPTLSIYIWTNILHLVQESP